MSTQTEQRADVSKNQLTEITFTEPSDVINSEWLITPESDRTPELSVVLPTLNEQRGVGECIEQIVNALAMMEISGEIIVADSSDDWTPDIAAMMGAHVVTPDGKGYGYAYQYAFEQARGEYITMGDADTTYDFTELPKLVALVRDGDADMAMGSRLNGEIRPEAMPPLHQYIGNPLLTKFLNLFYDAGVSDAHSGMRVFSRDAYEEMDCCSTGMEFASEMIMAAGESGLTIKEEPITYHPRRGEANLESFPDGWRHVRFMLLNAPGYLFSLPGVALFAGGLLVMLSVFSGVRFAGIGFGTHSLIMGCLSVLVGFQVANFGVFATIAGDPVRRPTDPYTNWILDRLTLERGAVAGGVLFIAGIGYHGLMLSRWAAGGTMPLLNGDIVGMTVLVLGLQLIFASFLLSTVAGES